MRVVFSPRALRDLRAIGDFIAIDSPKRAVTFVKELELACRSLASENARYPLLGRPEGYRRMPVGNYLVLYTVASTAVRIVRVIHAARDLDDIDF